MSGKSAIMFSATASGMAGQFWKEGDLMWHRVSRFSLPSIQ
jgi:hypothetical protein